MNASRCLIQLAAAAWVAALSMSTQAAMLCRWENAEGRTVVADRVPAKYKDVAECIDSRRFELTAEERREGEARAAAERKAAEQRSQEVAAQQQSTSTARPVIRTAARKPSADDCAAQFRRYQASQGCFAPYFILNGIRTEAYANCVEVPDPSFTCGAPDWRNP